MLNPQRVVPDAVVLDACVLISNVLRYLSLQVARAGWVQPLWSPVIADEWVRNASRLWQVPTESLWQDWQDFNAEFPSADQGGVQNFKEGLVYSDPKDWHVIAAARVALTEHSNRSVGILTKNLRDFNRSELKRLQIALWEPDAFFSACWQRDPARFQTWLAQMPAQVNAPDKEPLPVAELLKRERLFVLNKLYLSRIND